MNIEPVANNLKNTIAGKEQMLVECNSVITKELKSTSLRLALITDDEILSINIDELKRILQDVEQSIAKDVEQSLGDKPDCMDGRFTQDEINCTKEWGRLVSGQTTRPLMKKSLEI